MPLTHTKPAAGPPPTFEEAAAGVMTDVRAALRDLTIQLSARGPRPAPPIARAVDLERSLKLDKKLAWQLFRLTQAATLAEAAHVPARASVRRLLAAARARGVSKPTLDRVGKAFESFESFAHAHGGDREGLLSMIAGLGARGGWESEAGEQFELKTRKAAFRANAHLWGAQSRMQVRTLVQHVASTDLWQEHVLLVSGDIGLQRVRQADPLVMVRWWAITSAEKRGSQPPPRGAGSATQPVHLLQDFSTRPLPNMLARPTGDGSVETELIIPAGRTGAVTLYSSQFTPNATKDPQHTFCGRMFVTIPVETAVWEILVPAGLSDPSTVRGVVYGRRAHPESAYDMRPSDLLPSQGAATYLGVVESVPPLEGAPQHADAVRHVLDSQGWLGTRYDAYRFCVRCPVLHTLCCLLVDAKRR